jgi:hypothetical protein
LLPPASKITLVPFHKENTRETLLVPYSNCSPYYMSSPSPDQVLLAHSGGLTHPHIQATTTVALVIARRATKSCSKSSCAVLDPCRNAGWCFGRSTWRFSRPYLQSETVWRFHCGNLRPSRPRSLSLHIRSSMEQRLGQCAGCGVVLIRLRRSPT